MIYSMGRSVINDLNSKFKTLLLKLFKVVTVGFLLVSIFEYFICRDMCIQNEILVDEYSVVSKYDKNNFMYLTGLASEEQENHKYTNLTYLIIPDNFSSLSSLTITNLDGDLKASKGGILASIVGILSHVFGIYFFVIGAFKIFKKLTPRTQRNQKGKHGKLG